MDQNKTIIDFNKTKNIVENFSKKQQEVAEQKKSVFEEIMTQVAQVNPSMGGFEELASLLSLPDEQFNLIAPIFLDELQKSMNNVEDKILLVQAMNLTGTKLEELQESYNQLMISIDEQMSDVIPQAKKDFLKRMMAITYNSIADAEGVARRIINIPIELTSDDAKIPKYAHLGDGAVDLYSPADYTIKPGETVIIPCDIKVALPYGYAFLIHPRSGISAKTKLRVANSIGLVDSQYKGVIGVIVENIEPPIKDITYEFDDNGRPILTSVLHGQSYYISKGERFAQMRLVEVPTVNFYQVENVEGIGDDRGGGFGSSGTN